MHNEFSIIADFLPHLSLQSDKIRFGITTTEPDYLVQVRNSICCTQSDWMYDAFRVIAEYSIEFNPPTPNYLQYLTELQYSESLWITLGSGNEVASQLPVEQQLTSLAMGINLHFHLH